ncbi:MAG TPA: nicotinate (nicotinamide) nucleotide adenylyltransferase [bacterium]|jgi:nicotinate-nucleotide adenylyltransferase|nr:nicotinate (nicotinamide) nucleotide adenylyltransferase [bacterium]MDX9805293.1 nicotinate (nicotinamide) nucleotide adenylyltransferase [bacterium]HNZ54880.1 nicotinate (nicotinamide) nucleotide adenylyltransferase [bacterium]HOG42687.1 nicotinate (nicotinamide) nucleotide adenylyltransferase [bacterium]HPG36533.1 nicotinate (nicotinamide) nucleotide adenylyltransferase [bacterium]
MSNNIKDIAVFGGKFDPPHLAHRMTIDLALEKYKMDEVWLIPSFNHPFGFKTTSFEHRLEMCRILAKQWPEKRIKVLETEREINSGFTIDVLKHFSKLYPEYNFHLFIGADNWKNREKWKEFNELERICKSIKVIGRGKDKFDGSALPDISSTMIKQMIHDKERVALLLPEGIEYYIRKNSLYI